jgi:hypothetical protein
MESNSVKSWSAADWILASTMLALRAATLIILIMLYNKL